MGRKDLRNRYDGLDAYAVRLIRSKAGQLARSGAFSASDRDDLEQELALDLLVRLRQFDRSRSKREAFISTVVRNRAATLVEARKAAKRGGRDRAVSLHDEVEDADGQSIDLWRTLDETACERRVRSDAEPTDVAGLRIDLEAALGGLPPDLQQLAERLMSSTPSEVARATCMPRHTVHYAIGRIRAHFKRLGLQAYLPGSLNSQPVPVCLQSVGCAAPQGRSA